MNLAFFEKIGLFLALFEHSSTGNTEPQFFVTRCCQYKSVQKKPKIVQFSKNMPNSDVQGKSEFFITNSDSTLQVCMKFVFVSSFPCHSHRALRNIYLLAVSQATR